MAEREAASEDVFGGLNVECLKNKYATTQLLSVISVGLGDGR